MNRTQKAQWIEGLRESLDGAEIVILVHYKGLNVSQMTELRVQARQCGTSFKVTKNSLMKLAVKDSPFGDLSSELSGPTAVAYSSDPVSAAKVVSEFSKKNDHLVLLTGIFGNTVLDSAQIQELAKMPSLDELRAKIISLINTPATRIAGVVQAPAGQLARVFSAYSTGQS